MHQSALYIPYKAIGYVTDANPFVVTRLGDETFITTSIGKSFQVYRFDKLVVCLVSRVGTANITCLQAAGLETFAAIANDIVVYNRHVVVRTYKEHKYPIKGLINVGHILLSFDENNEIKIIDVKARVVMGELKMLQSAKISVIVHPATYLNKFLIGYENAELELWNMRSRVLVYTFQSHLHKLQELYPTVALVPAIRCIEQSPACDVIAIGFSTGDIFILNIKLDKVLFTFCQSGAVTSLSFRTDVASVGEFPLLCSGSSDGRIHVWHLGGGDGSGSTSNRRLMFTMEEAHGATVTRVHFLHGEPLLLSSGADNSLKVWIFDAPDGSARLLKSREGPSGPLTSVRPYGGDTDGSMRDSTEGASCEMLCTGQDGSLRLLNSVLPEHSREMSQKTILKRLGMQRKNERLPPIIDFDFSETRQRDWGNIVTCHRNHSSAYVWRHKHRAITEIILKQPHWLTNEKKHHSDRSTHSTAVSVSSCGNYCVVGSRGGVIYMYNLQSGLPRGAFPAVAEVSAIKAHSMKKRMATPGNVFHNGFMPTVAPAGKGSLAAIGAPPAVVVPDADAVKGHVLEVTGLFMDAASGLLLSCGADGYFLFWDIASHALLHSIDLKVPQTRIFPFRDGGFVALLGQDRVVRVYDMASRKLSRRFDGHSREVTDVAFTPDGRRLLTASLDGTVRVWDMPTGRCLSWMKFDSPVSSLSVSLSGDQIAVVFTDRIGVYLYVDRSLYETVHFWQEPREPVLMADCEVRQDEDDKAEAEEEKQSTLAVAEDGSSDQLVTVRAPQGQVEDEVTHRESTLQRGVGAITLSTLPKAYWTTLFHLDEIKERNRAKEAPKAPEQAPFFLPTMVKSGATPSFPTPAEYEAMKASDSVATGKRRAAEPLVEAGGKKVKKKPAEEEDVEAVLAALGSAWADDEEEGEGMALDEVVLAGEESGVIVSSTCSRILRGQRELPRCTLALLLLQRYPLHEPLPTGPSLLSEAAVASSSAATSKVSDHLMSLAPPAVDLELRALCEGKDDKEGLQILARLLTHLAELLVSGTGFELAQAYLHRTLVIYAELLLTAPGVKEPLETLLDLNEKGCFRLRDLIQSNLCLLKLMANLPPT